MFPNQDGSTERVVRGSMIANLVQQAIRNEIVAVFNDQANGERPVQPSDASLFEPGSVIWRVHSDVTSMMVGGIASLLMQMLHPAALAGVWDHSRFREDMQGRLRATARFLATTTFASASEAQAAIDKIRRIHERVTGRLSNGTSYSAADPHLLAWVHLCQLTGQLSAWQIYGTKSLSEAAQDRYIVEAGRIALALGANPVPFDRGELAHLTESYRRELRVDDRTRTVARLLLRQRTHRFGTEPLLALTLRAGVDLLPAWAADMHCFNSAAMPRPIIREATRGVAHILRWALQPADRAPQQRFRDRWARQS
jgi:uncharacterized protein (DUF2236 family)